MYGILVTETGGPEVLRWSELPDPVPAPGTIVVELVAAGLNFIDTYHRNGLYPVELPFTPGVEGAGVVTAVADGVDRFSIGDRVAWSSNVRSYAETVGVRADVAVRVPDGVDLETAAAALLQGMTAHYLTRDTFPLAPGDRCLVHAGAGGVGLLLIQVAKRLGAEVFTTVGSAEKAELARGAGADHVILYRERDFGDAVEEIAGKQPLDVVYDGVGKTVFSRSLDLLGRRGMMVQFGNASGPVDPVSPLELMRHGSLFLTRPTLFDYVAVRQDLERRARELFEWIEEGSLHVRIGARTALADAAEAHRMLEGRRTTGKVILVP